MGNIIYCILNGKKYKDCHERNVLLLIVNDLNKYIKNCQINIKIYEDKDTLLYGYL